MPQLPTPTLEFFVQLDVQVGPAHEVGATPAGNRRVIPITGGTAKSTDWSARVLSGGADFQLIVTPSIARLDARYVLETDGGDLIYVSNQAMRVAAPEVTSKLVRGEPVDPALVYFRCVPAFETSSPSLGWINERLFVGTGVRRPDRVEVACFVIR